MEEEHAVAIEGELQERERERVSSGGGAAKEREMHAMTVEKEEHAMASRLLVVWRESCKRVSERERELIVERDRAPPRRRERERVTAEKIRKNLALDFFGLTWCSGCGHVPAACLKALQFFLAAVPMAFDFFTIRVRASVNDDKNEA
jgi:hypothetical protein